MTGFDVAPAILASTAAVVMAVAFWFRDKPEVQRDMPRIIRLVSIQVVLAAFIWILDRLGG